MGSRSGKYKNIDCGWCQSCLKRLNDSDIDFALSRLEEDYTSFLIKRGLNDNPKRKSSFFKQHHKRHICIDCWGYYSHIGWCSNCCEPIIYIENNIEGTTKNQCPVCGNKLFRLAKDLRPVFSRERLILLFYKFINEEQLFNSNVWRSPQNPYYFFDGVKVGFPDIATLKRDSEKLREFINNRDDVEKIDVDILKRHEKTVKANDYVDHNHLQFNLHISKNEEKARAFLLQLRSDEEYKDLPLVVSFSGGKDSTVVADLVKKQLGLDEVDLIFNNTTLEEAQTIQYIRKFSEEHELNYVEINSLRNVAGGRRFLYNVSPKHSFSHMLKEIGPPSRGVRWCCHVFKAAGINDLLHSWGGKALTIYGIRNSESVKRSFYCPVTDQGKMGIQITASPIISWTDFDIWLYIFKHKLSFNDLYRYGYSRVGCWLCPMNSEWSDTLNKIYFPSRENNWRNYLVNYAKELGKPDPEEYVDSGNWKKRFGGAGRFNSYKGLKHKICGLKEDTIQYNLKRIVDEKTILEYFKPFGEVDLDYSNFEQGMYHIKPKKLVEKLASRLIVEIRDGSDTVRVTFIKPRNYELIKAYVKYQMIKYEVCIKCTACEMSCPHGAIHVDPDNEEAGYIIDQEICREHDDCLECTWHFESSGCLIAKSLFSSGGKKRDEL